MYSGETHPGFLWYGRNIDGMSKHGVMLRKGVISIEELCVLLARWHSDRLVKYLYLDSAFIIIPPFSFLICLRATLSSMSRGSPAA